MKTFDLTQTITDKMPVFPGEKLPSLLRDELPEEATYISYRLETNMHTGTHMDAPLHAKSGNLTIDQYPADFFTGRALVIDVRGESVVKMREEWLEVFRQYPIILFCTSHDQQWGTESYYNNYPVFEDEVAYALKRSGVRIAGFDSPSPDMSPFTFHSIFLNEQRFLIENLTGLHHLLSQECEFIALPLKIKAEASLIRAIARI
jgi:kynurenine formamidase